MEIMLENVMEAIVLIYVFFCYIILPVLIFKNFVISKEANFEQDENENENEDENEKEEQDQDSLIEGEVTYIPRKYRNRKIRKIIKSEKEILQALSVLMTSVMIFGGLLTGYFVYKIGMY